MDQLKNICSGVTLSCYCLQDGQIYVENLATFTVRSLNDFVDMVLFIKLWSFHFSDDFVLQL